jgi:hypothetical protein
VTERLPPEESESADAGDGVEAGESAESSPGRRRPRPMPEREELVQLLERYRGNVTHVARHLDRHWGVIQRALIKHQINADAFRPDEDE